MIFVTVGASPYPFDRLLEAVATVASDELVVQHGPSTIRPRGATCFDFLPFDEVVANLRLASAVITHAGIGSILLAATHGKRPLVVPRLSEHGEAVDDHQLGAGRKLEELGLIRLVEDPRDLLAALEAQSSANGRRIEPGGPLAEDIRQYLEGIVR